MIGKRPATIDDLDRAIRNLRMEIDGRVMAVGGAVGDHDLLSTYHADTLAADAVQGDLIYAESDNAWTRLPLGAAGEYVRSDGTDVEWSELLSADIAWGAVTGLVYLTAGVLSQKTLGIANTNIPPIDHVSVADNDFAKFTASGLEGRSYAETLADLSGQADAMFDWNDQRLENVLSLEVKDLSVDTADDYIGLENHHKKTAGASDADDDFYAHDNYVALNQPGGTIGYLSGLYTESWLIDGTIAHDLEAIYNKVVISGGVVSGDVIGSTDYLIMNGGSIDDLFGHITRLDVAVALTITGDVYGHYIEADIDTDPTGDVYMLYLKEYDNVDYGFYQDGSGLNVFGGALQLDTVADAAGDVDKFLVLDAGDVLDYRTAAELLADLSGDAGATFDWNGQNLTGVPNLSTKTTAAWSKTIGATGNYATWAAMIADMPDLIAHAVTVTIETGTHLTEECLLDNKSGLTSAAAIQIKAAKYYPTTYGATIPTADSATATTLRDTSVFTVADYYNDCWVVIVNGTGTDNGPVQITDTDGVNGDIIVASWPGTQPDNTSEYIICGAHIDAESTRWNAFASSGCSVPVTLIGICFSTAQGTGGCISLKGNSFTLSYCVAYGGKYIGLASSASETYVKVCGIIGNNTTNYSLFGGVFASAGYFEAAYSRISDNLRRGVMITYGANANITLNAGDNNGLWGTECKYGGQADCAGAECSGSSGNHSDTGTAGSNSADQASAY